MVAKEFPVAFSLSETDILNKDYFDKAITDYSDYIEQTNVIEGMNSSIMRQDAIEMLNNARRQYHQELLSQGFGIKRSALRKKDIIDMRDLLGKYEPACDIPPITLTDDEREFGKNNFWFAAIPCFSEGVLQVNDARYIYWNTTDIDIENSAITVILHDYKFHPEVGWVPGIFGTAEIHFASDMRDIYLRVSDNDFQLQSDIYRTLNYKKFKWGNGVEELWTSMLEWIDDCTKTAKSKGVEPFDCLISVFLKSITKINYTLSQNKVKTKRIKTENKTQITVETETEKKPPVTLDNRKIRTVGSINFNSTEIPRVPTEKTIIKYTVPAWKTRGFIRTLASGKKVPVRESIHHRKCLEQDEATPVTIRFKNSDNTKKGDNG